MFQILDEPISGELIYNKQNGTILLSLIKEVTSKSFFGKSYGTQPIITGKLNGYLADINKQAEDMLSRLVEQMAEREGVTEELKANSQMEWVARMNNIRSRATETVNHDIIYG